MSDDTDGGESLLATEVRTTAGRILATTLASGASGVVLGILTVPTRALDVPTTEEQTYGGDVIHQAAYHPIDPFVLALVLAAFVAAMILVVVYSPPRTGGDDDE